ncbi:hypothetical protein D8674_019471 [Pyrus ussuriensis x Pyrus communis]|uniref:No apical meristem-associated C-terminal domain-containing protein n=1 Tax=Pyrus ussuriensis x Pyrus communis TaxID=2448454 RepID=A0A5N5G7P7_9ROSA|nr:hypothetical protein D8674_019471 [Pyrus ussuriensis x Pyrus communis]
MKGRATSSMKGMAWTRKEDEVVCRAYRWVSEDSVKGSFQTSRGVWTRTSKKYYEFYECTTPSNSRNHETVLKAGSRRESRVNYYDEVNVFTRILYELYMEDNSKPFSHHGCWEICKGWVLFEDPPQERFGPTQVFGNVSSNAVGDEHGSPTIQETKVENPSPSEVSIPRTTGRNKAQTLKEKGKANRRHEERAKQIQEEMNDRNMQKNTSNYTPMSKA